MSAVISTSKARKAGLLSGLNMGVWGRSNQQEKTIDELARRFFLGLGRPSPCLRELKNLNLQKTLKNLNKGGIQNMKKLNIKMRQKITLGLALTIITLTTGCASTCHKKNHINSVIESEIKLLQSIKKERLKPEFITKLSKDKSLLDSENRLQKAIDAMISANGQLKKTLGKKGGRK